MYRKCSSRYPPCLQTWTLVIVLVTVEWTIESSIAVKYYQFLQRTCLVRTHPDWTVQNRQRPSQWIQSASGDLRREVRRVKSQRIVWPARTGRPAQWQPWRRYRDPPLCSARDRASPLAQARATCTEGYRGGRSSCEQDWLVGRARAARGRRRSAAGRSGSRDSRLPHERCGGGVCRGRRTQHGCRAGGWCGRYTCGGPLRLALRS